ncbi:MAG: sulfatase-like hydrolase/transferase [Bryobacterales bacterium]
MNPPHTPYTQRPERYRKPYDAAGRKALLAARHSATCRDRERRLLPQERPRLLRHDQRRRRAVRPHPRRSTSRASNRTRLSSLPDHGDCIGIHEEQHKNNHFEESMRVPFLVRWPGKIPPSHDKLLLSTVDIYPTLLDLAGLGDQIPPEVDGRSRAKSFLGQAEGRPTGQLYLRIPYEAPNLGRRGVRTERYTLMVENLENGQARVELYDRRHDPYQLDDLSEKRPALVAELLAQYVEPYLEASGDPWSPPAS